MSNSSRRASGNRASETTTYCGLCLRAITPPRRAVIGWCETHGDAHATEYCSAECRDRDAAAQAEYEAARPFGVYRQPGDEHFIAKGLEAIAESQRTTPRFVEEDADLVESCDAGRWRLATLDLGGEHFAIQYLVNYGPSLPGLWADVLTYTSERMARREWGEFMALGKPYLELACGERGCEEDTFAMIVAEAPGPDWPDDGCRD